MDPSSLIIFCQALNIGFDSVWYACHLDGDGLGEETTCDHRVLTFRVIRMGMVQLQVFEFSPFPCLLLTYELH